MDRSVLVGFDLQIGQQIVEALDANGFKLSVAAWVVLGEYGDARLLLASRSLNQQSGLSANKEIYETLRLAAVDFYRIPPLLVLRMNDPFVRALRQTFGGSRDCGLKPNRSLAEHSIEEMYIYRIQK